MKDIILETFIANKYVLFDKGLFTFFMNHTDMSVDFYTSCKI